MDDDNSAGCTFISARWTEPWRKSGFVCTWSKKQGRNESINSEKMEMNNSHSKEKQTMGHSSSSSEVKKPAEKDLSSSAFVNQAAIRWHESRKKWVHKQSQQQQIMERESIISWSTAYEDLLSTNEPFSEPIPLPEMVDFLVDIWHDEGLFD